VPLEGLEPLVERVPVDVVLDVALLTQLLGSHIVVERAMDSPSPKISSVTPCSRSLMPRPSAKSPSGPDMRLIIRGNDLAVDIDIDAPAIRETSRFWRSYPH